MDTSFAGNTPRPKGSEPSKDSSIYPESDCSLNSLQFPARPEAAHGSTQQVTNESTQNQQVERNNQWASSFTKSSERCFQGAINSMFVAVPALVVMSMPGIEYAPPVLGITGMGIGALAAFSGGVLMIASEVFSNLAAYMKDLNRSKT